MTTPHTIVFPEDTGQTLTVELVKLTDDSTHYAADTVTERTNAKGIYDAAFSDLPAGDYTIHTFVGGTLSATGIVRSVVDGTTNAYEQSLASYSGGLVVISAQATSVSSSITSGNLEFTRGDTVRIQITGLGDISDRQKLWFTVKNASTDADSDALLQVVEGTGATIVNGASAGTPSQASLTVTDEINGIVTLYIDKVISAAMSASSGNQAYGQARAITGAPWDMQVERNNSQADINTVVSGLMNVNLDITRAIS